MHYWNLMDRYIDGWTDMLPMAKLCPSTAECDDKIRVVKK